MQEVGALLCSYLGQQEQQGGIQSRLRIEGQACFVELEDILTCQV